MRYHILNGDALFEKFPAKEISDEIIVTREAFIEGPLATEFLKEYWERRGAFIMSVYGAKNEDYETQFVSQLKRMASIKTNDKVYLWFEDDLFCQTNMWFSIYYITRFVQPQFFRIFPKEDKELWTGFGRTDKEQLIQLFNQKELFSSNEIELVNFLWEAYVHNDEENLQLLSKANSKCLRFLPELIEAHLDRIPHDDNPGRPKKVLREIMDKGKASFYEIFSAFSLREGIYGYGDLQIKNMLEEMGIEFSGNGL